MPLSLTDRAPEVAMKTAGGAAARGDGALRRQPDGSAAESTAGHAPERTRFAAEGRKFGRWGSGLGQLFALAAGERENRNTSLTNNKTLKYKEASPAWDFGPLFQLTSSQPLTLGHHPRTLTDLSFHNHYGLTAYAPTSSA